MNIEELKARLRKMKALADRGEGGERDVAERMIEEIAARYGLLLDFLDAETERRFYIKFTAGWQRGIFIQLLGLMRIDRYGDRHADKLSLYYRKSDGALKCYTICTEEEWLELCAKYEVLKRDYKRQRDAFFRAFLIANDLLMPYDPDDHPSKAELDQDDVAESLAMGITKSKLHRQLEMRGQRDGG